MKMRTVWLVPAIIAVLGFLASGVPAEEKAAKKEAAPKEGAEQEFPWDNGPDTIDVSGYPAEQQQNYKVFAKKCSKCHTLARAINSPYALPEEWEPYVKKMQKKKRSGLDAKSAKKVVDFLIYDSSIRKKDLQEKKLKEKEAEKKKG